jgi:PilZ domain
MSESEAKDPELPQTPEERRGDVRHFACFPAHIQRTGGSLRMALIRDLSVSGALLMTRARLEVGEPVQLSLYLSEETSDARPATGRVVRVEQRTADRAEVWHHTAAVQFDDPLRDCEAEIKSLAERQAALGVPRD